jgi:hypothetical protein
MNKALAELWNLYPNSITADKIAQKPKMTREQALGLMSLVKKHKPGTVRQEFVEEALEVLRFEPNE